MKSQAPVKDEKNGRIIWFTGRPASGKSTLSHLLKKEFEKRGERVCELDGEMLRKKLNSDLGFSKEDRKENVRRISEVACLFCDFGIITLVCTVSPFEDIRRLTREICKDYPYIEIYIKAELNTCIRRDYKNIYDGKHVLADCYEEDVNANLIIDTDKLDIKECIKKIVNVIWGKVE